VKKTIEMGTDVWSFLIYELGATPLEDSVQQSGNK
jgi:hypothetical protein